MSTSPVRISSRLTRRWPPLRPLIREGRDVVELRFFGGLSVDETAAALKVSPETVMRDWKLAKVWLARELEKGHRHG